MKTTEALDFLRFISDDINKLSLGGEEDPL